MEPVVHGRIKPFDAGIPRGDIEVDSTPGEGTAFRLLFPLTSQAAVRTLLRPKPATVEVGGVIPQPGLQLRPSS